MRTAPLEHRSTAGNPVGSEGIPGRTPNPKILGQWIHSLAAVVMEALLTAGATCEGNLAPTSRKVCASLRPLSAEESIHPANMHRGEVVL